MQEYLKYWDNYSALQKMRYFVIIRVILEDMIVMW